MFFLSIHLWRGGLALACAAPPSKKKIVSELGRQRLGSTALREPKWKSYKKYCFLHHHAENPIKNKHFQLVPSTSRYNLVAESDLLQASSSSVDLSLGYSSRACQRRGLKKAIFNRICAKFKKNMEKDRS